MKAYLIQDAIGDISDKLIIDAEIAWQRKMRRTPRAIFLLAACLVISLSLMLAVFNRINDPLTDKPNTTPPGSDHSGVVPPEDNTIPDTPIDPESLSKVLEVGYDSAGNVGGMSPMIRIAVKIDRTADLLQDKIPITVSYGVPKGRTIDDFKVIDMTDYKIGISYLDHDEEVILKEMTFEEFFEKGYFYETESIYDSDGYVVEEKYTFLGEEDVFYLDTNFIRNTIIDNEFQGDYGNRFHIVIGLLDYSENYEYRNSSFDDTSVFVNGIKENTVTFYSYKEHFEIYGSIY